MRGNSGRNGGRLGVSGAKGVLLFERLDPKFRSFRSCRGRKPRDKARKGLIKHPINGAFQNKRAQPSPNTTVGLLDLGGVVVAAVWGQRVGGGGGGGMGCRPAEHHYPNTPAETRSIQIPD